jgi:hypothetical protein
MEKGKKRAASTIDISVFNLQEWSWLVHYELWQMQWWEWLGWGTKRQKRVAATNKWELSMQKGKKKTASTIKELLSRFSIFANGWSGVRSPDNIMVMVDAENGLGGTCWNHEGDKLKRYILTQNANVRTAIWLGTSYCEWGQQQSDIRHYHTIHDVLSFGHPECSYKNYVEYTGAFWTGCPSWISTEKRQKRWPRLINESRPLPELATVAYGICLWTIQSSTHGLQISLFP